MKGMERMRTRRITQLEIARFYQRLENEERRRKAAEAIKEQKSFLKKLFGRP
jgi:hypothetical protein